MTLETLAIGIVIAAFALAIVANLLRNHEACTPKQKGPGDHAA